MSSALSWDFPSSPNVSFWACEVISTRVRLPLSWPCLGRLGALKGLRGPRHSRWTSSPPRPMPRVFSVPRVSRHSGQTSPLLAVPWVTMGSWAFDVLDTLLWRAWRPSEPAVLEFLFPGIASATCLSFGVALAAIGDCSARAPLPGHRFSHVPLIWRCFGGHRSLQCSSWGSLGPSFRELLREILRGVPTQSQGSRLRALRGNWVSPSCRPKRNYSRALLLQGSDSITWLSSPALKRRGPPPSFRPKRN